MNTLLTLTLLDHKPHSWNELWRNPHWSVRKKIKEDALVSVRVAMSAAGVMPGDCIAEPVDLLYISSSPKPLDSDNILTKPYTDALVTYGVLPEDDHQYVRWVKCLSEWSTTDSLTIHIVASGEWQMGA